MYIATIDYYDHETGHRKTTVDPRLLFKLVRSVRSVKSGKVRNDIGIGDVLVISEDDDIETVDKKVGDVLRAWGYPGRKPLAMCEHIEAI